MTEPKKRGGYYSALSQNELSFKSVDKILALFKKHLTIYPVPPNLLKGRGPNSSIDKSLARLPLYVALGGKSWGGLVVCFPGGSQDLSTTHVSTPYLRKILHPILDLQQRLQTAYPGQLRCIYLVGDRFSDVFLRKFRLLDSLTPHVVVLTKDLLKAKLSSDDPEQMPSFNEAWTQAWLSKELKSESGLEIPTSDGKVVRAGFLANELPTGEGTKNPERLDILAYDKKDKTMIAFELKGPGCNRSEFENLFLQGAEHRNWLEANKMAVKFFLDGTSAGRINTRKRVRLVLGFFQDHVPLLFQLLKHEALKKDRHLKIDFLCLQGCPETGLTLTALNDNTELDCHLKSLEKRQMATEGFSLDEYGRKSDKWFHEDFMGLD